MANFLDTAFNLRIHRALLTLVVGILGTLLSALGILGHFVGFLIILGVAVPPVASIMVVDYYILRTHRSELAEGRKERLLPSRVPAWNVVGWVSWIAGALIGYYVNWGIGSVNSLIAAGLLYFVLSKLLPMVGRSPEPLPAPR